MSYIRRAKDGWEYACGVEFSTEIMKGAFVCMACHATGDAIRLNYPVTLYFDRRNLTTEKRGIFLCNRCAYKLLSALNNPANNRFCLRCSHSLSADDENGKQYLVCSEHGYKRVKENGYCEDYN